MSAQRCHCVEEDERGEMGRGAIARGKTVPRIPRNPMCTALTFVASGWCKSSRSLPRASLPASQ